MLSGASVAPSEQLAQRVRAAERVLPPAISAALQQAQTQFAQSSPRDRPNALLSFVALTQRLSRAASKLGSTQTIADFPSPTPALRASHAVLEHVLTTLHTPDIAWNTVHDLFLLPTEELADLRLLPVWIDALKQQHLSIAARIANEVLPAYGGFVQEKLRAAIHFPGNERDALRLEALAKIAPEESCPLLARAATEGALSVRLTAFRLLGALRSHALRTPIEQLLKEDVAIPALAHTAMKALFLLETDEARALQTRARKSNNPFLREAALSAFTAPHLLG